eukprot:SAG31_NODE_11349_length_1040_cov_1.168969_1_plen_94_part_00
MAGGFAQSQSDDFFGDWIFHRQDGAYDTKITIKGSPTALQVSRRERPKVFIENGTLMLLINGVCLDGAWGTCFTFAQPVNRTVPWLSPLSSPS